MHSNANIFGSQGLPMRAALHCTIICKSDLGVTPGVSGSIRLSN